jgi:peptidoglycan/xylan/chitin deacetylase (PgdA/CDA1 family)
MSDVTRGKFLKELGRSLPGMILGSGVAGVAQKVLGKVAAVSNAMEGPNPSAIKVNPPVAQPAEIPFIKCGPTGENRIALTFDDGPIPGVTDLLLDVLKEHGMKATFFMIGERIAAAPDLARRVLAEGHDVGNHTWTHPHLDTLSDSKVEAELDRTQEIMAKELHHSPRWFRAPYGALRQNQAHLIAARNMGIVDWSVSPDDWAKPGVDKITAKILAETEAGSIIVCHDISQQTVDSMKIILEPLSQRGLVFSTLSQLLR